VRAKAVSLSLSVRRTCGVGGAGNTAASASRVRLISLAKSRLCCIIGKKDLDRLKF
jgi:hypothetical protein